MNERLKRLLTITPLKITVFVILIALILFFMDIPFIRFMELRALDLRMVSRGKVAPGGETVIVTIDEKSLKELGRWPWPRTTMARLLDKLKAYGAKAVGFDVVFAEPDENASLKTIAEITREARQMGIQDRRLSALIERKRALADTDAALARSIRNAQNVTLGYFFHTSQRDITHLSQEDIELQAESIANSRYQFVQSKTTPDDSLLIHAYAAVTNLLPLTDAAENSGYFNAFPDSDGSIRWSPLVIKFGENYYSSLSLSLLLQYLNWPALSLRLADFGAEGVNLDRLFIPTDEYGRMLVNYLGPAETFPHYSVCDVLNDRLAPEKFRDKIVIVGATATGIYDLRVTPFSAVFPGVEIHATVIDNILHKNFLKHSAWTTFLDVCSIILFGLIMGIAVSRIRAVQGMLLALALLVAFGIVNAAVFSRFNTWLNMVFPVLTMVAVYLGITIYRYVTEEREKKKIRGAFQYYLTASVINEMLKDPSKLKLGGDKKDLSVLFSDIRGFTTVSERLTPEELVHLLNEYLTAMTDLVFKYDGLLDKYMGDAIMAVFGAPLDQPDHAMRACRTALDMMEELHVLQKKWSAEGKPPLDIGIGINTGEMVVGNMGSLMRFDYTVMGDSVNLGSRLEGINKEYGTNIVISEFTQAVVKDSLFCRELDSVRVKGKKLPVRIYELLGDRAMSQDKVEFVSYFEEGLSMYKRGLWDEAIILFRKVLELKPGDPPSALYIKRCEMLKENPPEGEWDGVFTMTTK
ncbi:MAG: CHASE2 domain-containing protein [Deltaproteobacteria bacterium]|nr:CHASE2 domain-containing protein [Deltaproteobacteria bacterium]